MYTILNIFTSGTSPPMIYYSYTKQIALTLSNTPEALHLRISIFPRCHTHPTLLVHLSWKTKVRHSYISFVNFSYLFFAILNIFTSGTSPPMIYYSYTKQIALTLSNTPEALKTLYSWRDVYTYWTNHTEIPLRKWAQCEKIYKKEIWKIDKGNIAISYTGSWEPLVYLTMLMQFA
jgi:hypothetical protein